MTTRTADASPRFYARAAGFLYLLLAPLGVFGILYVPTTLIVAGDAAATAENILAAETTFRLSIVTALITQLVNILVVLALYKVLRPVNKNHAALMVVLFLVSVPITMLTEVTHLGMLILLSGPDYLATFSTDQLQALALLLHELHEYGLIIASIFWGLWLLPMGYLVFKSGFLPRLIGILLVVAGVGYLVDFALVTLLPDVEMMVGQFTFIGEVALALWLLVKGVDVQAWEERARQAA